MSNTLTGRIDGWGEQEDDGTWTAFCRMSTGFHSVTAHEKGFKSQKDAESWARERASEANAIIRKNGANIRKKFDCRIEVVK